LCLLVGGQAVPEARAAADQIHINREYSNWRLEGEQAGLNLGRVVRSAGDVNGDGYPDLLLGLDGFDDGALTDSGAAYVYYGGASGYPAVPSWQVLGTHASEQLGYSVAPAGDVNADGFDDVIVGAVNYAGAFASQGRADVYYGSADGLLESPNWTLTGEAANTYLGYIVGPAGDVNGDGYADITIYSGMPDWNGRLLVYHGSPTGLKPDPTPQNADWARPGTQSSGSFGYASAPVDANGDGYGDLLVGGHTLDNHHADEGMLLLYRGSPDGLGSVDVWQVSGGQAGATLGAMIASGRDVNADGFPDVLVGAEMYDSAQADEGAAFLFFGNGDTFSTSPDWTFTSGQANARGGRYAALPGDLNGDGFEDIVVSAHSYDYDQADEGAVFVFLGGPSGFAPGAPENAAWVFEGDQAGGSLGFSLFSLGDVNLDGLADIGVGGTAYSNGQAAEGEAMLFHGAVPGQVTECTRAAVMGGLELAIRAQQPVEFLCSGVIAFEREISITTPLTLDATGRQVTLSGQAKTRLFSIAPDASLTLRSLKVANGKVTGANGVQGINATQSSGAGTGGTGQDGRGGAIYNQGLLIAENVTFENNHAVGGTGGQGGTGYYYRYCGFFGCTTYHWWGGSGGNGGSGYGGAIYNHGGGLSITRSAFIDNVSFGGTAGVPGFGVYNYTDTGCPGYSGTAFSGAVHSTGGLVNISNTTFAQNFSGGGYPAYGPNSCDPAPGLGLGGALAALDSARFVLNNNTFAANRVETVYYQYGNRALLAGAAIHNSSGTIELKGNLLSDNLSTAGGYGSYPNNCVGALTSYGHNLSSDASCALSNFEDLNSTPAGLGPLGNYGGDTPAYPLLPGSPALGGFTQLVNADCPAADQRGVLRTADQPCDIGAYEALWAALSPPDQTAQEGSSAVLAVTLDQPAPFDLAVNYQTAAGTAAAGADYLEPAAPAEALFGVGEGSTDVEVAIVADGAPEGEETFEVSLLPSGWVLVDDQPAAVRILGTPLVVNDSLTTLEDTPGTVAVLDNDLDYDDNPLEVASVGSAAHGSVVINPDNTLTYTPAPDYFGPDSFTYTVDNGHQGAASASVALTVTPVNDPPQASADTYPAAFMTSLQVGAAQGVLANDSDVDSHPLSAVLVQDVQHGVLLLDPNGGFTYTPAAAFTGVDQFTYKTGDGTLFSSEVTVTLLVGANQVFLPLVIR